MITNYSYPAQTFQILEDSQYSFYLTGSRFFNIWHNHSDWDFFTTCKDDEFYKKHHFLRTAGPYKDLAIERLLIREDNGTSVHIQVLRSEQDLEYKNITNNFLKKNLHHYADILMNKHKRTRLWDHFLYGLHAGKDILDIDYEAQRKFFPWRFS